MSALKPENFGRCVYGAFFCPPFYEKGVIMIFANLVTDFSRMGYVRTDDDYNIELTADSNEFDDEEAIVRMVETVCESWEVDCLIEKDGVTDESINFTLSSCEFDDLRLSLIIA